MSKKNKTNITPEEFKRLTAGRIPDMITQDSVVYDMSVNDVGDGLAKVRKDMADRCPYTSDGRHVYLPTQGGGPPSEECNICRANEALEDSHGRTAAELDVDRKMAKEINFARQYGGKHPVDKVARHAALSDRVRAGETLSPADTVDGFNPSLFTGRCRCKTCRNACTEKALADPGPGGKGGG